MWFGEEEDSDRRGGECECECALSTEHKASRPRLASTQCNLAAQALVMQPHAHSTWRGCMGLSTSLLPSSLVPLVYCYFDAE